MKKGLSIVWSAAFLLLCGVARAQGAEGALSEAAIAEESLTVITSEHLIYDQQNGYAYFEKDVVVQDPEMRLEADEMTVYFDDDGKASSIVAKGNVYIEQLDRKAWAGKALYEVGANQITLEEEPRVERGRDLLQADVITFFRNEHKLVCEPAARLVIFP